MFALKFCAWLLGASHSLGAMGKKHHKKKKSRTSKAAPAQQPAMSPFMMPNMVPQMPFMMPNMFPQMVAPPPAAALPQSDDDDSGDSDSSSSGSSDSEKRKKYDKTMKAKLTGSACLIAGLPKLRLGEALEEIDSRFDSTMTADYTVSGCCKLLWLLTGQKPNTQVSHLRVKTYAAMYKKLATAQNRAKAKLADAYEVMLGSILDNPTEEVITQMANTKGWDDGWMDKKKK